MARQLIVTGANSGTKYYGQKANPPTDTDIADSHFYRPHGVQTRAFTVMQEPRTQHIPKVAQEQKINS